MTKIFGWRNCWSMRGATADWLGGPGYYRIVKPLQALIEKYPERCSSEVFGNPMTEIERLRPQTFPYSMGVFEHHIKNSDITFTKHFSNMDNVAFMLAACETYQKPWIIDFDDDFFSIDPEQAVNVFFRPDTQETTAIVQGLRNARAITVSTEPLADTYRPYNRNIHLLKNYNDIRDWHVKQKGHGGPLRIGWAGSLSHEGNHNLQISIVKALWQKYGKKIKFIFMGAAPTGLALELPKAAYELKSGVLSMWDYPQALADLRMDIGIAPLRANIFSEAKGHGKWMEYACLKVPMVGTKWGPYARECRDGFDSLLVPKDNPIDVWVQKVSELIDNPTLRKQIGQQAYDRVVNEYQWKDHVDEWAEVFDTYANPIA